MSWPNSAELLAPVVLWFTTVRRDLPWRAQDLDALHPNPYAVLVSELMLQQTQVTTVTPYFLRWMERFPDARSLAAAAPDEIHKYWEGLGYYRRARYLQATAKEIAQHGWPSHLAGFLELPGLGPYTAAALASIAFQLPEPALDGNAFRVLARVLGIEDNPKKSSTQLQAWLKPALEHHKPSRMTQALMELGALVCGSPPKCEKCPLSGSCIAQQLGATDRIPARVIRSKPQEFEFWLLAIKAQGRWLLCPPGEKGLLAGLWSWPSLALEMPSDQVAAEDHLPYGLLHWQCWPGWIQTYSHRREKVRPLVMELEHPFRSSNLVWMDESSLQAAPMGRRDQRLRELLRTGPYSNNEAPPVAGLLSILQSS